MSSSWTATERTNILASVISRAQALSVIPRTELGYNLIYQVWYEDNSDENENDIVDITEISSMRCDGLVEYCYEYYDLMVYGGNISDFNLDTRDEHSAPWVTPKQQIKHYLHNCLGDVNGDFFVTSADASLVSRYASELETLDTYQLFVGDVDGNGSVNSADARLILRYAAQLESSFPADPFP